MRTESQKSQIKKWLLSGRSLTPIQALELFGCFRLSARIGNLKDEGLEVLSKDVTINDKRFTLYYLEK